MRTALVGALMLTLAAPVAAWARPGELTLEARMGPYVPDTDPYRGANALDTSSGASAFGCAFGLGIRPIGFVSPQISVFDAFGTVLLGAEAGFYSIRARQLTNASDCSSQAGLTTNELTIVPLMGTLTYRFDWALDRFDIPLVPYLRLGLGGAAWAITEDGQLPKSTLTSSGQRQDAVGFSFGGKGAVGLMVALDFLEPLRAIRARAKGVYKHTYIFAEVAGFDAGMYQNWLLSTFNTYVTNQNYFGPTLVVGAERLPLLTAGFAVAF
ncbi:MAG: MXAN_2562 family outer membrane beta-barrel protein [Myxococcota bacterium]